jgi:hypothetical protein
MWGVCAGAHEQAATYCERVGVSLADYDGLFEAAPARMLDSAHDAPVEYHHQLTVASRLSKTNRIAAGAGNFSG